MSQRKESPFIVVFFIVRGGKMNLLIPGDVRSGKVPSRVLHNAVLPSSDPREYIVYKVFTRQDVSQPDSDFVLQSPSSPTHINPYQPISWQRRYVKS